MNNPGNDAAALSVVIPARNCKVDLKACLASLMQSSFKDFEIIVVDDASSDDTTSWIDGSSAQVIVLPSQSGPAIARNIGAQHARGEFVLFLDADVCVNTETVSRVIAAFKENPTAAAVFGSYDAQPYCQNVLSQYRNLMHHFVHQEAKKQATTFWSGCGAIRRNVFLEAGGFHPDYRRPCIEDIELGVRLHNAGRQIVLDNRIQVTHRKRWNLWGMLKTDVRDRAIPWSQLILCEGKMPNDLNLGLAHRVSALLACGLLLTILAASWYFPWVLAMPTGIILVIAAVDSWSLTRRVPTSWRLFSFLAVITMTGVLAWQFHALVLLPILMIIAIVLLNWRFYAFLARARQPLFAAMAVPLQIMYYLYSLAGFAVAFVLHFIGFGASNRRAAPVLISNPHSIYQRSTVQPERFVASQFVPLQS